MASHFLKRFPLFGDRKMINSPVPDLVNLMAKGVTCPFPELIIHSDGRLHCLPVLLYIFESLTSDHRPDSHDPTYECSTCLALPSHASSQSTACFEHICTANVELFLQSCKNSLCSTKIVHVVHERQFKNLLKKPSPIPHNFFLPSELVVSVIITIMRLTQVYH
jgi:hypothetical protein